MKAFILLIIIVISTGLYAQDDIKKVRSRCGNFHYIKQLEKKYPGIKEIIKENEKIISQEIKKRKEKKEKDIVITIPVVFHIVYNSEIQRVKETQIYSQIDVLNEDFRRLNYDTVRTPEYFKSFAANISIKFCLANRDEFGNPTNGIIYRYTDTTSFVTTENVKYFESGGSDIWDRNKYLNIWVCSFSRNDEAGYSTMPGFPEDIDGIVINYKVFGRTGNTHPKYNLGRTVTHEAGHWFGLFHLWGDASGDDCPGFCSCTDYVEDTPTQQMANFNCPVYPSVTCSDTSDMFMNYMDYTDDACMSLFSNGQKDRITGVLNTLRAPLQISNGYVDEEEDIDFTADYTNIAQTRSTNFIVKSSKKINKYLWIFNGGKPESSSSGNPKEIYYNQSGKYAVSLIATTDEGTHHITKYQYVNVVPSGKNDEIKTLYNYYKNDSLIYNLSYNKLMIDFGKNAFYNVRIKLFNNIGKQIFSEELTSGYVTGNYVADIPNVISNNIYFLVLETQAGIMSRKLFVLH